MGREQRGLAMCAMGTLLLALPAPLAQAQVEPLITDRPDFTESSVSVDGGRVQVEGGVGGEWAAGDEEVWTIGSLLVRIGLGGGWELRMEPGSYEVVEPGAGSRIEGLGDATLGAKVELPAIGSFDTALLVAAELPTGSQDTGGDGIRPGAVLALGRDLRAAGRDVGLGINLGYRRIDPGGERFGQASASVALGLPLGGRAGAFVEWFGFSREEPEGGPTHYLDGGFTWLWGPDLQFDVYVGSGLDSEATDAFAGVGFAARF